jgi:hypothetical protein
LSSTLTGVVVFACTFGAALLGIRVRRLLPSQHIQDRSEVVLKLVLGLMSTLTALVLGLLISSAYSTYQLQRIEIQDLGTRFFELDRALSHLGSPAVPQRQHLKQILIHAIERTWPAKGVAAIPSANFSVQEEGEQLFDEVTALPAPSNIDLVAQNRALRLFENVSANWHLLVVQRGGSLSTPILLVMMSWIIALFFGFGLLTEFNGTIAAGLCVGAAAISGAIFLITDLNEPYSGLIRVPKSALTVILAQMGH